MKFLVCVKEVPEPEQVRFDRANRVVREEVATLCNPLDAQALGHALALRSGSDEVVVVTMGPPSARAVLERAVRQGADRAMHLTDKRFKGADTLATARALAAIVRRECPDVVLFGRSTLDGATAQLGQQVAELSEVPHVSEAVALEAGGGSELVVDRETEYGAESWRLPLPAAVTVARGPEPPLPGPERVIEVTEIGAEELPGKPVDYGTRGSPTFVKEVRSRTRQRRGDGESDVDRAVERVGNVLECSEIEPEAWAGQPDPERDIWVLVERWGAEIDPITFEGLACGRGVAGQVNGRVTALLIGSARPEVVDKLGERGADRVLHVRGERLREFGTAERTHALAAVLERERPFVLVAPWTSTGRDHVPRAAARLGLGVTGDVTGVVVEGGAEEDDKPPRLLWVKPAWAGAAEALVISRTTPTMATLRPGSYRPLAPGGPGRVEVDTVDLELPDSPGAPRLVSRRQVVDDCSLDRAEVVFCLGTEVSTDTARQLREVAARCGAGVGGTAEAVSQSVSQGVGQGDDPAAVPPQWELSARKRSIAPRVCVVFGVRDRAELSAVRAAEELVVVHPEADVDAHAEADLRVLVEPAALAKGLSERSMRA